MPAPKPRKTRQVRSKRQIGETLSVLDINAGNISETSRALSLPASTIRDWRDNYANDPLVVRYRDLKNADLAERFRVVAAMAIERLQGEIDSVKVDNLMVMAATGADKHLLLTGQPTVITSDAPIQSLTAILKEAKAIAQNAEVVSENERVN